MLFLISSAPDTQEFKTAFRAAKEINAGICLLQNAVYAARSGGDDDVFVLADDMQLRGVGEDEISGIPVDYGRLIDLMTGTDRVVGIF